MTNETPRRDEFDGRHLGLIPADRIKSTTTPRPDRSVIERLRELTDPTGTLSDVMDVMGIGGAIGAGTLTPLVRGRVAVGPAVTLRYAPSRKSTAMSAADKGAVSMAEFELYRLAVAGDVVVIDAAGADVSCMGGMSATTAAAHGMAAVVAWGGVRDVTTILQSDLATWSAYVTPKTGKFRLEAVEINGTVMMGDVQVRPGDIVVADDTGVVVVPLEHAEEILRRAEKTVLDEERLLTLLVRGASRDELATVWGRLRARLEADRAGMDGAAPIL